MSKNGEKMDLISETESFNLSAARQNSKKTIILSLDDCLLKTSVFMQDLPRVNGQFIYNNLTIYVCLRPYLHELI